jgi:hypothetical protein
MRTTQLQLKTRLVALPDVDMVYASYKNALAPPALTGCSFGLSPL